MKKERASLILTYKGKPRDISILGKQSEGMACVSIEWAVDAGTTERWEVGKFSKRIYPVLVGFDVFAIYRL